MESRPTRRAAYWITLFAVLIPALIMIWNVQIGVPLLLLGVYFSYRAIRMARSDAVIASDENPDELLRRSARTILVQLVDDEGRELPPEIAEKRMAAAQAQANPVDTVVGVHYVLSGDDPRKPAA